MVKVPRFACSHTVTGSCVLRLATDSVSGDATISAGTYWTDPGAGVASSQSLLQAVADAWLAATGAFVTPSFVDANGDGVGVAQFVGSPYQLQIAAHSHVTAEGRRLMQRLGVAPYSGTGLALTLTTSGLLGAWGPGGRAESGSAAEELKGETGAVSVSADGTAYATYSADPQRNRLVVLQALTGQYVHRGARVLGGTGAAADLSLQTHLYDVLRRGERVRYYDDSAGAYASLAVACAAAATTVTLSSNTGASAGGAVCLNGEMATLAANTTGTTWTVTRPNPVAHAAGDPVGLGGSWVGTYVLAEDGGNVNRGEFAPKRRAVNQDRWDVELSLVRATP